MMWIHYKAPKHHGLGKSVLIRPLLNRGIRAAAPPSHPPRASRTSTPRSRCPSPPHRTPPPPPRPSSRSPPRPSPILSAPPGAKVALPLSLSTRMHTLSPSLSFALSRTHMHTLSPSLPLSISLTHTLTFCLDTHTGGRPDVGSRGPPIAEEGSPLGGARETTGYEPLHLGAGAVNAFPPGRGVESGGEGHREGPASGGAPLLQSSELVDRAGLAPLGLSRFSPSPSLPPSLPPSLSLSRLEHRPSPSLFLTHSLSLSLSLCRAALSPETLDPKTVTARFWTLMPGKSL